MLIRAIGIGAVFVGALATASSCLSCGGTSSGARPTPPSPSAASASAEPAAPSLCGCALCDPVVSEDACATDSDCAPSAPCHAPRCVGRANAKPRSAGEMCTEILVCSSIDANACSCVKGKCTLHSK